MRGESDISHSPIPATEEGSSHLTVPLGEWHDTETVSSLCVDEAKEAATVPEDKRSKCGQFVNTPIIKWHKIDEEAKDHQQTKYHNDSMIAGIPKTVYYEATGELLALVNSSHCSVVVHLFADAQTSFPSKKQHINKTVEPEFSKDPNFTFSSNVPEDGVFKAKNQSLCRSTKKAELLSKKTATVARGPVSRYRLETELKKKNQSLEIAKQQLQSKLSGAQGTIKDLRKKNEVLEEEVQKLKKFQNNYMMILESRNIDPVTGNEILEEEHMKETQKQTTLLTEKLKEELRLFSEMAAKQKEELQTATAMWKQAENDRNSFLEKQPFFQRELKEFAATAGQVELLLDT
nr:small kinetochore-associated protein [Pelodiscus sinensis]|eukprot:XP_014431788.1 small kinetochore-associated protein [Pelodiscus sinensis]